MVATTEKEVGQIYFIKEFKTSSFRVKEGRYVVVKISDTERNLEPVTIVKMYRTHDKTGKITTQPLAIRVELLDDLLLKAYAQLVGTMEIIETNFTSNWKN